MEVKFKYHKDSITLNIKPTDKVKDIKERLSFELGQLAQNVHLLYQGKTLDDDEILQQAITNKEEEVLIRCDDDFSDDDDDENEDSNEKAIDFELTPQSEFEIPSYTPPDFEEKAANLQAATGADLKKCEQALRLAFFNPDRAADYLLNGEELPEKPTILPYTGPAGKNYSPIPDPEQSPILQQLNKEELNAFKRVMENVNSDYSTAIQMFFACEKNPEATIDILNNPK